MSLANKLKGLTLELPDKLSEVERKILQERFTQIKAILDDTCEIILEMPREEAKRYYQLIVQKLQEADALFIGGSKPAIEPAAIEPERGPKQDDPPRTERSGDLPPRGGVEFKKQGPPDFHPDDSNRPRVLPPRKVNFKKFLDDLTIEEHEKASRYLDCVKQFESGLEDVICSECTPEELRKCIRGNDPTIKEPMAALIEAESRDPR